MRGWRISPPRLNDWVAAIQGLNGLLTGVLDLSRLDAGVVETALESVDVGALVDRLATEYAPKAANKGLELRPGPLRLCVYTDTTLLERMLRNLIENALRYTSKGGILLGGRRRGEQVRLESSTPASASRPINTKKFSRNFIS